MKNNLIFDIFSDSTLLDFIVGKSAIATVADITETPNTTVRRKLEKGDVSLLRSMEEKIPEISNILKSDEFLHPLSSLICGFYKVSYNKDFYLYESLEKLNKGIIRENCFRESGAKSIVVDEACRAINGAEVVLDAPVIVKYVINSISEKRSIKEFERYFGYLHSKRHEVIQEYFYEMIASFDIDVCKKFFSEYKPIPIFFVVMPECRNRPKGKKEDVPVSSERKLAEFIYCLLRKEEPSPAKNNHPTNEQMFWFSHGKNDEKYMNSYLNKIKIKTMKFDDYLKLIKLWGDNPCDEEGKDFFFILYIKSKIFSFLFQKTSKDYEKRDILQKFAEKYFQSWKTELKRRGVEPNIGKDWNDEKVITRLIRDSIRLPS